GGLAVEVKLDHDGLFVAHHPAVMTGIDGHDLRRPELALAAVRVLDVDLAPRQKPHVRVHAELGADDRLHVRGPAESRRVNHALDAAGAGARNFKPDVPDIAALGARHWFE